MASQLQLISHGEMQIHNKQKDCWIAIEGKVYDITSFLPEHPGGDEVVLECAGTDATLAFKDIGHSASAEAMLSKYLIGELDGVIKEEDKKKGKKPGPTDTPPAPSVVVQICAPIAMMAVVGYLVYKLM
uniref:Cytochrome b5 heme-binding domain-containing protein n=2 Tax=Hemiselmis andersenii TaxID=464988 RepID=A0A6U5BTJ8_HEMAN|mmetsp:Transcript_56351/g.136319  ORF Transcript_56351/g.136319 Transcript_56351/m.136319 type:complete len:129 (+) Transcript_56351:18-404(+)